MPWKRKSPAKKSPAKKSPAKKSADGSAKRTTVPGGYVLHVTIGGQPAYIGVNTGKGRAATTAPRTSFAAAAETVLRRSR